MSENQTGIPPVPLPGAPPLIPLPSGTKVQKVSDKYIGLKNQGSTCYLNSLIQSLFMTPEFRYHIFKWNYDMNFHGLPEDCIPFQLQKLFSRLQNPIRDSEETVQLTKSFQWDSNQVYIQQDIEELCRVLFEAIEISIGSKESNFINDLYSGETHSVVKCLECNNCSINKDLFLDLSLPILNIFENIHNKSLEMAILNFIKQEKLENDNQYQCGNCNKKVNALKYLKFEKLPEILFIQLGRFYYDYQTDMRQKIHDRVPFPLILNMNKYKRDYDKIEYDANKSEDDSFNLDDSEELKQQYLKEGKDVYELYSIVIQSGSANGGHYYAYIKSFEDGKWYNFNDMKVIEIDKKEIIDVFGKTQEEPGKRYQSSTTAYCLMYHRVNGKKYTIADRQKNEILENMIKEENEKIKAEEKERKEKFNRIAINIYYNDVKTPVNTHRTNTISTLKDQICKEFKIDTSLKDKFRIREFDLLNKKKLGYIENDDETIEKAYITPYKVYTLQFADKESGLFPAYDSTLLDIYLYNYEDNKDKEENFNKKLIIISNLKKMNELTKLICETLNIDYDKKANLLILKKVDFGYSSKVLEIEKEELFSEKTIFLCSILDRCELYIEYDENKVPTLESSQWMEIFKKQSSKILVKFLYSDKGVVSEHKQPFSKYSTMKEIKAEMCKIINKEPEKILMRKDIPKGQEILDLKDELGLVARNSDTFTIFLVDGSPIKENEIVLNLSYCQYNYEKFNFYPYKFTEISNIVVLAEHNIEKVKEICIRELKNKHLIDPEKDVPKELALIRFSSSGRPTKILCDKSIVDSLGFCNNMKIVIQILETPLDTSLFKKDIHNELINEESFIELSFRLLNIGKWSISPPSDIIVNCDESINNIAEKILSLYPSLDSIENIEIIKIANGYGIYMDSILNMNFSCLFDYLDSSINQYPFFIKNDGYMLIVKDKRIAEGDVTDEIRNYCFQPAEVRGIPPLPKGVSVGSSNRVKNMINLFEKGDYDIVTHTKKGKDERPKIKEKGIVIKVKRFEDEVVKGTETKTEAEKKEESNDVQDMMCNVKTRNMPIGDYPDNSNDIEPLI